MRRASANLSVQSNHMSRHTRPKGPGKALRVENCDQTFSTPENSRLLWKPPISRKTESKLALASIAKSDLNVKRTILKSF
jgi:hypothetical protein